jgi:hypothetical protein
MNIKFSFSSSFFLFPFAGTGDRLLARTHMQAGDEVRGFYGHKSDSDLAGSYGFT